MKKEEEIREKILELEDEIKTYYEWYKHFKCKNRQLEMAEVSGWINQNLIEMMALEWILKEDE